MDEYYSALHMCVYVYIHQLTDTSCFFILAIESNASMNTGTHVSLQVTVFVFLDIYPGVEIVVRTIVLILIFWTSLHTTNIFRNGCTNLHSYQQHKSSLFSISSPAFVIFDIFDNSHSDRHDVITCSFDLHFPDYYQCWAPVHVPVGQLSVLFGKNIYSGLPSSF